MQLYAVKRELIEQQFQNDRIRWEKRESWKVTLLHNTKLRVTFVLFFTISWINRVN